MKERSYAVRVYTHPAVWGDKNFLASRTLASKLLSDAVHVNHLKTFCALPLPAVPEFSPRPIPGTCTVSRHSAYSFSSDVIQRVICEPISEVVCHCSTREIA